MFLRFFTVLTQTHTHLGRVKESHTNTYTAREETDMYMYTCVCFACCAYLAGPHLQQGQRTGWFVIRRCCAASRTS